MKRSTVVLVLAAFLVPTLAGCLGADDHVDLTVPRADLKVTPVEGTQDTFRFDASGSTGKSLQYAWFLGDGTRSNNKTFEHTYAFGDATYEVILRIRDASGVEDIAKTELVVGSGINTAPEGLFDVAWRMYAVDEPVVVDASASSDPEGDPLLFDWDFNYFMDGYQYLDFRAAKEEATPGSNSGTTVEDGGGSEGSGSESGDAGNGSDTADAATPWAGPGGDELKALLGPGHGDTPGHGGGPGDISSTSTTPMLYPNQKSSVLTLDNGFPQAGIYFIRLVVKDVKGASAQYWSEEIIPVKVVDAKTERFHTGTFGGNFTLGGPEQLRNATNDGKLHGDLEYRDEAQHTFKLLRNPLHIFINLTWTSNGLGGATENDVVMFVKAPSGSERRAMADFDDEDQDGVTTESFVEFLGGQEDGIYEVALEATRGHSMTYTIEWWAEYDFNDFRQLEQGYDV